MAKQSGKLQNIQRRRTIIYAIKVVGRLKLIQTTLTQQQKQKQKN